ncbi:MAG: hypothetical protein OXR66_07255 [Candidatus Woesearchaeota archaeon]|nr:hypothetical protein [Candidatus Woesearchaeota archaeon]
MKRALLLGLLFCVAATLVYAVPSSPTEVNVLGSSSRQLPQVSNGTISAQGGNITEVHINALSITKSWQGYFGNITGNIRLDDANNDTFYAWGNTTVSGEVYASRNDTISWTTINCTNATERTTEETYLGHVVADGDSITNTFNSTSHPSFFVGLVNVTEDSCFSTNAFVNGAAQSAEFYQMLLSDNESNVVYTTIIETASTGFNGQTVDFQLLVGENEHSGSEGPTTYYFFTELS